MATRNKIDSNETSLFYAEEESLGVLPAVPVWLQGEPNEYDDFGGEFELLARNPINRSRQRKKGVIVDLDASGGFQQDFTQTNFQELLQAFMFADIREKSFAAPSAVTAASYTVGGGAGTSFPVGSLIFASGFRTPANNGVKVVTASAAGAVSAAGLVIENGVPADAMITLVGIQAEVGELGVTVAGLPTISSDGDFDFLGLGLIAGEWVYVGGDLEAHSFATPGNNGFKRLRSVTADTLTIDTSLDAMAVEAGAGKTVRIYFGRVLRNELGDLVKRRSYHLERQLGAPETTTPNKVQAEYVAGAIANEFEMTMETADKIVADISFIGTRYFTRKAADGTLPGTRPDLVESDAFNTSSDIAFSKLFLREKGVSTANPLFGFLTDFALTINNNAEPNKAIGVLGAFDVTAGTFEVSAEATAYFSTVEATDAVANNADCQFSMGIVKNNAGVLFDLPMIGLGDGRNEVEADEAIMLNLTMDAAAASKYAAEMNYTLLWMFFDYLPNRANTNNS